MFYFASLVPDASCLQLLVVSDKKEGDLGKILGERGTTF